jgi:hypothetical protein
MKRTLLGVGISIIIIFLHAGSAVALETLQIGPLRIPYPEGWVKTTIRGSGEAFFDIDPRLRNPGCRIDFVLAGFGDNPKAFRQAWAAATGRYMWNLNPPVPVEFDAPGNLTLSIGAIDISRGSGQANYAVVANLANYQFGQAFAAYGLKSACEPAFRKFLGSILVEGEGLVSSSKRSNAIIPGTGR